MLEVDIHLYYAPVLGFNPNLLMKTSQVGRQIYLSSADSAVY